MWKKFCKTMFILGKNCTGLSPCVEGVWIYNTGLIIFYFYCLNFSIKQCWLWEIKPNKNLIFTEYICTIYNECWLRERNQNKDPKRKKMQIWNLSEHTCAIYCILVYPNICLKSSYNNMNVHYDQNHIPASFLVTHFHTCMSVTISSDQQYFVVIKI